MRKGFVGLRHLMDLVAFANRVPLALIGFQDFGGQSFLHGEAFPGISKTHNPPQGQRGLPFTPTEKL